MSWLARQNPFIRVSDGERDATIRLLRDGHADGRIGLTTLEERVERALAAKRVGDLHALTVDIARVSRLGAWFAHAIGTLRPRTFEPDALGNEASLWLGGIGDRPIAIGRGREADLAVDDDTVSRLHARIARGGDGYVLTDLGSTNGTWIAGRRVGQIEVVPGDVVFLASRPLHLL